jgi:DNA-binding NtrC family response regulator
MPLVMQVKLLRALESGEVMPVGATRPQPVDVRLVSATHRDLAQAVAAGTFREDLLYRVRGIEIALPRLAERAVDLPLLAQHFLRKARALVPGRGVATVSPEAMRRLEQHDWPGNLRELRHEMQRALVMAGARGEILEDDLSPALRRGPHAAPAAAHAEPGASLESKIGALERREIALALEACGGNKSQAAARLGLSRQGLLNKMARHGL